MAWLEKKKKKYLLSMGCGHFPRVSPGICLTAEENPGKPQLRRPSDEEAVRPVIALNGILYPKMRSIVSHSTSGMEKEGKDGVVYI